MKLVGSYPVIKRSRYAPVLDIITQAKVRNSEYITNKCFEWVWLFIVPTFFSPAGVTFTKIIRGCVCRTSKIWLSLYQFYAYFPPISIQFSKEKYPILTKLGVFYNNLPKIHPIYVIWKLSDHYTKFREKVSQKAGTYMYTMSMWEPPGNFSRACSYPIQGGGGPETIA